MRKTIKYAIISLACALALTACASTVQLSRKNMLQDLQSLIALEDQYGQLQQTIQVVMLFSQEIPDNKATKLKEHNDIYWVHHLAANVAVANGDMAGYEKHVEAAKREVDAMDAIVNEWSRALVAEQGRVEKTEL